MKKNMFSSFGLKGRSAAVLLVAVMLVAFTVADKKPTLFLIGDSTVKNGAGMGGGSLWGWGSFLGDYFDSTKITVENDARGGTSSRTFQTQGLWDKVLAKVRPGDFVMLQFGHNDSSPINDSSRARGTIKGTSDSTQEIVNLLTKKPETVHSYGWYLRKIITEAKAKGATVIVCTPVPRNGWKNGKVGRVTDGYGKWAKEVAASEGLDVIDLDVAVADIYDAAGQEAVKQYFTEKDHTHTNKEGAIINAQQVVAGIKKISNCALNKFLK